MFFKRSGNLINTQSPHVTYIIFSRIGLSRCSLDYCCFRILKSVSNDKTFSRKHKTQARRSMSSSWWRLGASVAPAQCWEIWNIAFRNAKISWWEHLTTAGIVHMSSFTHFYVVPNLYNFIHGKQNFCRITMNVNGN